MSTKQFQANTSGIKYFIYRRTFSRSQKPFQTSLTLRMWCILIYAGFLGIYASGNWIMAWNQAKSDAWIDHKWWIDLPYLILQCQFHYILWYFWYGQMDVRGVAKWANGGERHGHLYLKRPMGKSLPPLEYPVYGAHELADEGELLRGITWYQFSLELLDSREWLQTRFYRRSPGNRQRVVYPLTSSSP